MSQGIRALMAMAAGTRMSLLRNDPLATAHTTGSSRSARTPETCSALRARSSPSTPAVFFAATLVIRATIEHAGNIIEQGQQTGSGHIWHSFY
jgi:hypothetical protein